MKMPHVDDHTIRSAHSPHHPHTDAPRHHQSYHYDKRPSEAELSPHVPRREAHSPPHWRPHAPPHGDPHHYSNPHPSMDHSTGRSGYQESPSANSSATTPPASPHVHPRYDYSSYDSYRRGGPSIPPYSQRGGYSYYHHHPHSRPPMMPRDMHAYPPSHYHPHPHPADMSPPPPYTGSAYPAHHQPPRYETPPLTTGSSSTSYYHDQQYPNFLPPSASMSTTASSRSGASSLLPREDEEYAYDSHSPQAASAQEEVNQVGPNDVLCGRGAPTNYHPGNEYFRDLVKQYQSTYLASKRADKPFVASHIVSIIQSRGGRFLRRYKRNGVSWERGHFVWVEVDPQKAYEKACQALREGAPEIRRKMQETESGSDGEDNGERIQEGHSQNPESATSKASPKENEAQVPPAAAAKCEQSEDTRNDEMQQESERSNE